MMSPYQSEALKILFSAVVRQNVTPEVWNWLNDTVAQTNNSQQFNIAFVSVPRKTGKSLIHVTQDQEKTLRKEGAGLIIASWTIDRLCRVWLLAGLSSADKTQYFQTIENLFLTAEVNELVALYSALPVLAYPEMWSKRCAEGIRSNIGAALEAIMCYNPYPAAYLDEQAWNQLVLKAFFTGKPVEQIIGLDIRANAALAKTLSDYAHERWAANRTVHPQIWRCTGKFIDKDIFPDMERLAHSENALDREAAALACADSSYPPAQELLNTLPDIKSAIASGELNWNVLAEKIKNHVLQS